MSIEDNVNSIFIKQVFHLYPHTLCFSIMCLVGAVPRWMPCSYQPWSYISVNRSQVSLQPLVLVSCNKIVEDTDKQLMRKKLQHSLSPTVMHVNKQQKYFINLNQVSNMKNIDRAEDNRRK